MAILHKMRYSNEFSERYCYIASDGWAYERPSQSKQVVWRYPHDGGTQTDDSAGREMTRGEIGEDLWKEIWHAFLQNKE